VDDRQFAGNNAWRFVDVTSQGTGVAVDYRVLAGAPWVEDVSFEFEHLNTASSPPKPLAKETVSPRQTHHDPWVWRHIYQVRGGNGIVRVRTLVGATVMLRDEIDLASLTGVNQYTVRRSPPRLVLDVNDTPRSGPGFAADSEAESVTLLMQRIGQNLGRSLDESAWLGPNSGRGLGVDEIGLAGDDLANERWARRITEMFLTVIYRMPGTIYGGGDTAMYDRIAARQAAGQEGFYPVLALCQQLCTVILLAHGVPRNLLGNGVNAGLSYELPVFKSDNGGAWHTDASALNAADALAASPPVGRASLYEFCGPVPNSDHAHIGAIIRIHNGSWHGLQSFDTGGLRAANRTLGVRLTPPGPNSLGSGIFDDPWVTSIRGSKAPFAGVGVIGTQHQPPADLDRWWPAGFARLVVNRRADNTTLYATPLLRMHDANRDYPVAALANALRGVPFIDTLEPRWEISAPRQDCATAMMTLPRDATVAQIVQSAGVAPDQPLRNNVLHLFKLYHLVANTDESVRRIDLPFVGDPAWEATAPDTRPWGEASGSLEPEIDVELLPSYLQGDALP